MTRANLCNLMLFQLGWLTCVLGAAKGLPWIGPAAVASIVTIQFPFRENRVSELLLLLVAGVLGYAFDSFLVLFGFIGFPEQAAVGWPTPVWMIALWCNLAMTINGCLSWLRNRLIVASVLGGLGGVVAYEGGVRFGALQFTSDHTAALLAIGVEWIIATPILFAVATTLDESAIVRRSSKTLSAGTAS